MDKRKGIILAIVLFLIIGLGTFVFAGGSEDEGSGNGTITPQPDGGDDNDPNDPTDSQEEDDGNIEEGGNQGTGTTRPAGGSDNTDGDELVTDGEGENNPTTPTVDYKALLDELANMVETATSKEDLAEAEQFRKDNNITEENVATLNDEDASKTYDEVIAILTDNNPPVVTPDDLNGSFTNKDSVSVEITDTTDVSYTLTINGEEVTDADLANLTEEGNYELTVTDSAFNSTTITFTVDRTDPVLLVNDEEVENGETIYVNEDAKMTVAETNLETVLSNKIDITKAFESMGSWTAQKDGAYNIVVTDKAGNTATYTIVVDKTPIEKAWLYVLNNTYSKTNLEDKHYTVIGDGQELYVELVFEEMPATTPLIQIGNAEAISMDACYATDWDTEIQYYKCPATIKIDSETQELENGQLIPVKITNIKDAAGNETILTNDHIDSSDKYDEVVFDKEAPEATKIRMYGGKYSQDTGETIWYVNEDSSFTVYVDFAEELFVNPKLDINDITGLEMKLSKCEDGTCIYYYKFSEIEKLNDGFVSIKVYDYSDAAGNVGDDLFLSPDTTNQEIELKGQKLVYIDKTNPTRGYSTLGFEYTDNSDKTSLEINGENVYYVKPRDSFLYKIAFSEKIQDGLIATIAGTDISLEYLDYNEDLGYIYGGTYTVPSGLTEGERLDIVVSNIKDLAGNEYAAGTITDVPTSNHRVAVFDNTPAGYNSVDFYVNNGYQEGSEYYATYGSTIVANIRTNELLRENPTFEFTYGDEKIVISGDDVEFTDEEKEEYTYLYRVRYTIPEDFEEIEEEVTLNITNIVDYAGNVINGSTTVTNSKRVFIDTLAPQVEELRFNSSNSINNGYANNTHSVGVYITVHEELAENPVFTINGIQYKMTEQKEVTNGYFYAATTKLPADTEEGKLTFSVTVTDKVGNTATYTNDDIKNDVEGYDGVIYDTTAPGLTVEYWDTTVEADKDATFEGPEYSFSDNFTAEEDLTITQWCDVNMAVPSDKYQCYYSATDLAGNSSSNSVFITVVDTTPATITANQKDNYHVEYDSEFTSVTATVTDNVDETIRDYEPRVYIRYTYPSAEYNTGELYYNNTFNTTIPGYYLAIWDYTDSSGNISDTLKRWVIVSDTTAPDIEG